MCVALGHFLITISEREATQGPEEDQDYTGLTFAPCSVIPPKITLFSWYLQSQLHLLTALSSLKALARQFIAFQR